MYCCHRLTKCGSTFNADVASFKVRLEIVGARLSRGEQSVGNANRTSATSRATRVHQVDDVSGATHVTVVVAHAPAEPHASVARMRHQDGRSELAAGVESFRLAVHAADLGHRTCA